MATPLENAEKRLAQLRQEIARVEQFIRDYHEFAADFAEGIGFAASTLDGMGIEGNVSAEKENQSVDNSARRKVRPEEIAQLLERVIREVGRPMTRGQLVQALERRDVDLPAADKARYIGTIIWRHKSVFMNVKGLGYMVRGMPTRSGPGALFETEAEEYSEAFDRAVAEEREKRALED